MKVNFVGLVVTKLVKNNNLEKYRKINFCFATKLHPKLGALYSQLLRVTNYVCVSSVGSEHFLSTFYVL